MGDDEISCGGGGEDDRRRCFGNCRVSRCSPPSGMVAKLLCPFGGWDDGGTETDRAVGDGFSKPSEMDRNETAFGGEEI